MKNFTLATLFAACVSGDCVWNNIAFLNVNDGIYVKNVASAEDCHKKCQDEQSCAIWSYEYVNQKCSLYPEEVTKTTYWKQNIVSGLKECCDKSCDSGFGFANVLAENEGECRLLCYANDRCVKHMFAEGSCTLKTQEGNAATIVDRCCGKNCPVPVVSPCIEPNVRYFSPDYDLPKTSTPSFYECVQECRTKDGCKAVTYHQNGDCYLKATETAQLVRQKCTECLSVRMDCCAEAGMKVSGRDYIILKNVKDRRECETQCLIRDACLGFTYNTKSKECDMKTESLKHEVSDDKNDIAGQRFCCDDEGLSLNATMSTVDAESVYQCRLQCQGTDGCVAFTFTRADGKCALQKEGYNTTTLPKVSDGVSGPRTCWIENAVAWHENDLDVSAFTSLEACQKECIANDKCSNVIGDTKCHLKERSSERYNYQIKAVANFKGY